MGSFSFVNMVSALVPRPRGASPIGLQGLGPGSLGSIGDFRRVLENQSTSQTNPNNPELSPPTPPTPPNDPNDINAQKAYNEALLKYNQDFQAYHTQLVQRLFRRIQLLSLNNRQPVPSVAPSSNAFSAGVSSTSIFS